MSVRTPSLRASAILRFVSTSWWAPAFAALPFLSLGWLIGVALQLQLRRLPGLKIDLALLAAAALVGLLALAVAHRRRGWAMGALGIAALLTAFATCDLRASAFIAQALAPSLEGVDLALVVEVESMPQRGTEGVRFRAAVREATQGDRPVRLPPHLQLAWYAAPGASVGALPEVHAGERWAVTARLKAPHGNLNPLGFDYELWLWEQGIQATGSIRSARRLPESGWQPVERARQQVREAIFSRVTDVHAAGVIAALVTGDQSAVERADWDVFRATGVAHLMSISGLHVTMFAWLATALVARLWRRSTRLCLVWPAPKAAALAGVLLAGGYAWFSGLGVPAQRTLCMLGVVALLRLAGRRWPWPVTWLLAAVAAVVVDPWALMQAGFWLSFGAVGALLMTDSGQPHGKGLGQRVRALLREQLIVTIALAPLSMLLFHQVSVVGLVANLIAIPWVTLLVTPLALAGVLCPPLWALCAICVSAMNTALGLAASGSWAVWQMAQPPLWLGIPAVLGAVLSFMRLPLAWRGLGVALVLPLLLWHPIRPAPGRFDILALEVGQGSAIVLRTAGRTLVYDAGPRYGGEADAGQRVLAPFLAATGERLDRLVLSHRDTDHTGGAASLLAAQPQADLWSSLEEGHPLTALRPSTRCFAGQSWDWDGVHFEMLHPLAQDYAGKTKSNGLSCVLRVSSREAAVLLTGDIEAPQERALLERLAGRDRTSGEGPAARAARPSLAADVLLVPHHGSKTSSTVSFIGAVDPAVAIVQAGYRNRFGHPAPLVLQRYRDADIPLVSTVTCGAVHWRSDRAGDSECEREIAQRYWRPVADVEPAPATEDEDR